MALVGRSLSISSLLNISSSKAVFSASGTKPLLRTALFASVGACVGLVGLGLGPNGQVSTAQAGFVSPSAWHVATTKPSDQVLARRAALTGGVGSVIAASEKLNMEESWALSIFYQSRGFSLVWMDEDAPTKAALDLAKTLSEANSHALPGADYADAVEKLANLGAAPSFDDLIEADVLLSRAALLYARHASAGRIKPRDLSKNITIDPVAADPAETLTTLASASSPGQLLEALNPQSEEYNAMRRALNDLRASGGPAKVTTVPAGKVLKPGMSDARISTLRQRLVETGDLQTVSASAPNKFDDELVDAVKAFQNKKGLPVDSVVGPMTLNALNDTPRDQVKKIVLNMERRRWLPDDLGARHVFVNQTDFRVNVVQNDEVIHTARVVIGKRKHQSPAFSDEMETVVFNPYWNVPASITKNEYMPQVFRDPTIMARRGFQSFVSNGSRFVPTDLSTINWSHPDAQRLKIRFRQPPGGRNALGRVKFLFPNEHAVYLHDTPSKSLFKRASRAFSHGCIRVQDPLKLAEVLLSTDGWSRKDIDKAVASGRNQHIKLTKKIPVHLAYWTAFADDQGVIQYRDDVYGRDERLAEVMGLSEDALKLAQLTDN